MLRVFVFRRGVPSEVQSEPFRIDRFDRRSEVNVGARQEMLVFTGRNRFVPLLGDELSERLTVNGFGRNVDEVPVGGASFLELSFPEEPGL